ncbi:hypothetical protein P9112_007363 [Eukaryota sp. TZLM1-RC]
MDYIAIDLSSRQIAVSCRSSSDPQQTVLKYFDDTIAFLSDHREFGQIIRRQGRHNRFSDLKQLLAVTSPDDIPKWFPLSENLTYHPNEIQATVQHNDNLQHLPSSLLLGMLLGHIRRQTNGSAAGILVVIPGFWTSKQREIIKKAVTIAGFSRFKVLTNFESLLHVNLSSSLDQIRILSARFSPLRSSSSSNHDTLLVFDMCSHSTFMTVIEANNNGDPVLKLGEASHDLGYASFDTCLAKWLRNEVRKEGNEGRFEWQYLVNQASFIRNCLSVEESVSFYLDGGNNGSFSGRITRKMFKSIVKDLFDQLKVLCQTVSLKLSNTQIARLHIVERNNQFLLIERVVAAYFNISIGSRSCIIHPVNGAFELGESGVQFDEANLTEEIAKLIEIERFYLELDSKYDQNVKKRDELVTLLPHWRSQLNEFSDLIDDLNFVECQRLLRKTNGIINRNLFNDDDFPFLEDRVSALLESLNLSKQQQLEQQREIEKETELKKDLEKASLHQIEVNNKEISESDDFIVDDGDNPDASTLDLDQIKTCFNNGDFDSIFINLSHYNSSKCQELCYYKSLYHFCIGDFRSLCSFHCDHRDCLNLNLIVSDFKELDCIKNHELYLEKLNKFITKIEAICTKALPLAQAYCYRAISIWSQDFSCKLSSILLLSQCLSIQPNHQNALLFKGIFEIELGLFSSSVASFTQLVDVNQNQIYLACLDLAQLLEHCFGSVGFHSLFEVSFTQSINHSDIIAKSQNVLSILAELSKCRDATIDFFGDLKLILGSLPRTTSIIDQISTDVSIKIISQLIKLEGINQTAKDPLPLQSIRFDWFNNWLNVTPNHPSSIVYQALCLEYGFVLPKDCTKATALYYGISNMDVLDQLEKRFCAFSKYKCAVNLESQNDNIAAFEMFKSSFNLFFNLASAFHAAKCLMTIIDQAQDHYRDEDVNEVVSLFEQVLGVEPQSDWIPGIEFISIEEVFEISAFYPFIYFNLAQVYRRYLNNINSAMFYYQKGFELECPACSYELGLLYMDNSLGKPSLTTALACFKIAIKSNHAEGAYQAGICSKLMNDFDPAIQYFQLAHQQGYVLGWLELGKIYLNPGLNFPKDLGISYLKEAAKHNITEACLLIGDHYLKESLTRPNSTEKALEYYRLALESPECFFKAGLILMERGNEGDVLEGRRLCQNAAECGFPNAMEEMGKWLLMDADATEVSNVFGYELKDKCQHGVKYLANAAKKDNVNACKLLGKYYQDRLGSGDVKDDELALTYWKKAADLEDLEAIYNVARLLHQKSNPNANANPNLDEALLYYQAAFNGGHHLSCFFMVEIRICRYQCLQGISDQEFHDLIQLTDSFSVLLEGSRAKFSHFDYENIEQERSLLGDLFFYKGILYQAFYTKLVVTERVIDDGYFKKAIEAFEQGSNEGAHCAFELFKYYSTNGDSEKKKKFLNLAAKKHHPHACFVLGDELLKKSTTEGDSVTRTANQKAAAKYFKDAVNFLFNTTNFTFPEESYSIAYLRSPTLEHVERAIDVYEGEKRKGVCSVDHSLLKELYLIACEHAEASKKVLKVAASLYRERGDSEDGMRKADELEKRASLIVHYQERFVNNSCVVI